MDRKIKRLRKEARRPLKAGRRIVKHGKKKLPAKTWDSLNEAVRKLREALKNNDLKQGTSRLRKVIALREGEAAAARKSTFREWTESILFALILVFVIRSFIVQPFKIPTGSMTPTLLGVKKVCPICGREYRYDNKTCSRDGSTLVTEHIGDKILVNKFIYGAKTPDRIPFTTILLPFLKLPAIRSPQRGDVVVFHFPEELNMDYVKRLVGLPGETIEIREGRILADGEDVTTAAMAEVYYENIGNPRGPEHYYGQAGVPFTVPEGGMVIPLEPETRWYWEDLIRNDGHNLEVREGRFFIDGEPGQSYTVEQDYYYVLGDNSKNSRDSRFWGFVPRKYLVGEVFFKYWPPKRWGFVH